MEKTQDAWNESGEPEKVQRMGWKELYLKEDWWAIWLGLGFVIVALMFFANGSSIKWITLVPAIGHADATGKIVAGQWTDFSLIAPYFASHFGQYIAQFVMWLVVFTISIKTLGFKLKQFYPSFLFIYVCSAHIGVTARHAHIQHDRPAEVDGHRVSGGVLYQDGDRADGCDLAIHLDHLGGPRCHRTGLHRFNRDMDGDLFCR
jgi:hypothetical protein